jgi:transcriptional regulator with XRE-family HTH domain
MELSLPLTRSEVLRLAWMRQACINGEAKRIRKAARITQAEIGAACGVTDAAVALWEKGSRMPAGESALAYARLLQDLQAV